MDAFSPPPLRLPLAAIVSILFFARGTSATVLSTSSPSLFVFGASIVDAGENAVAMPFRQNAEFSPYGLDYFGKPVGRWSNGRTFLDHITETLGYGHLMPYLRAIGSNFTYGVNFASSGSTAVNTTATGNNSGGLFCLLVQVDQFQEFQESVLSAQHGTKAKLRLKQQFSNSIYLFETASNDYAIYAFKTDDYDPLASVLATIASMRIAFEAMYRFGARTFIVMNVTPLGCAPGLLNDNRGNGTVDEYGCQIDWNEHAELHNKHLVDLLDALRTEYPAAEWILFDAYNIFLDAYHNPSKYGLNYTTKACCGAGGKYNVNADVLCGMSAQYINGTYVEWTKCEDPSLYMIWDTIHPVDSFAYHIAQGVLNGTHLTPYFNISERAQSVKVAKGRSGALFM